MIKNFLQFNESIKHLLVGPSEDEIWNNIKDLPLNKILYRSSDNGFLKGVKYAIENGADVHYLEDESLWRSIHNNHFEVAKYLIENGADINVDEGYPMKHACEVGDLDMVKFMLEYGGNKNEGLFFSCMNGHYDVTKYLLENGSNPNHRSGMCLEKAKINGHNDIVELLQEWM